MAIWLFSVHMISSSIKILIYFYKTLDSDVQGVEGENTLDEKYIYTQNEQKT